MLKNQITVVINSFKSEKKILKCLSCIDKECKIIVIENSNDKLIKEKIEKNFNNTECFLTGNNLGYAKGNNLGLSKVKTPYALIINPDALIKPNTIENFLNLAKKINNFAIIAPAIQDEKNISNNLTKFSEVKSVKGFAMFLNIKQFDKIGFFDENFFIYLEEVDLCRRLNNNNKKIFVDPSILIEHQGGSSHEEKYNLEMELSRNWHWMWSTFYYTKKYNGYYIAIFYILKKLISSTLKFIFYFLFFNKKKKLIYKQRLSGLYNSIIGKPAWYRPFCNN